MFLKPRQELLASARELTSFVGSVRTLIILKIKKRRGFLRFCGGETGIRTLGPHKRTTVFETAAFDHSAIFPGAAAAKVVKYFTAGETPCHFKSSEEQGKEQRLPRSWHLRIFAALRIIMKVLVFYYSQSGQMKNILDHLLQPLQSGGTDLYFAEIRPDPPYPFPWTSDQFFDSFPESFTGIPCQLEGMILPPPEDFDLVVLGYSPWYLSPSIPIHAFLQSETASRYLKGKKVITVIGSRNMWLQAQEKVKRYLRSCAAELAGNIALYDKAPNLVSVLTIIRWLIKGKKEAGRILPAAGVRPADIENSRIFGEIILRHLQSGDWNSLQDSLIQAGAVNVKPNLVLFERNGSKIFRMWSSRILKKGPAGDPRRRPAHRLFKIYLLIVLFVVSPLANVVYAPMKLLMRKKIAADRHYFSHNGLKENH